MKSTRRIVVLALLAVLYVAAQALVAQDWKCIVYGDTRNNTIYHKEVLASMKKNTADYKFILNVGDVVDHGYTESEWIDWQNTCISFLGGIGQDSVPPMYMSCPGNHDQLLDATGLMLWNKYLPGQKTRYGNDGKFFTFDYQDARFVLLDSEFSPKDGPQRQMLTDALERNPRKWIIVLWHKPIFSYGEKTYQDATNKLWGALLYQRGCDIIANGDAHYYVRTTKLQLNGEKYPPIDTIKGVTIIVTGNGGAPIDVPNPTYDGNSYMIAQYARTNQDYGYTELHFKESTLSVRHIFRNGSVFDQTTLTPNPKYQAPTSTSPEESYLPPQIRQSYPNPFNHTTTIRFSISDVHPVDIVVIDLRGRVVKTLARDVSYPLGEHQIRWNGRDDGGNELAAGVYFFKMRGRGSTEPTKMIMLK